MVAFIAVDLVADIDGVTTVLVEETLNAVVEDVLVNIADEGVTISSVKVVKRMMKSHCIS